MTRATLAHINLAAMQHNLQIIKSIAPHTKVIAMIKADAYGHGLVRAASALTAADAFGVACLEEALVLRDQGISKPIVLMEGFYHSDEIPLIDQHRLDMVVHHQFQVDALAKAKIKKPLKVWLKIDTGMHRLGFLPEQIAKIYQQLKTCKAVADDIVLMTHFSDADHRDNPKTDRQLQSFQEITQGLPGERSLANSAAILAWPHTHGDWIRPGLTLYGVTPFTDKVGVDYNLKPVMTLSSQLIAILQLRRGDQIGYGSAWECPENMRVGVVAIGYGDGYPHHARNGTPVLLNQKVAPLVGHVSMDMISVDLRQHPNAKIGDPVTLWGEGLPVEHVAIAADTIAYELLCNVTGRVQRVVS